MITSLAAGAATLVVVVGALSSPAAASAPPTSTALVLSATKSPFGRTVVATATVSATSGQARGDVVFTLEGVSIKANLSASGTATTVLPRALVGEHPVTATFVPQVPESQQGSASPAQTWVVTQVRTWLQVRVAGRGARIPTTVQVTAAGTFGTRPTGRVNVVVRRTGTPGRTRVVRRLSSTAVALAELGRLRKGDYRLVVTYVGDSQHLRERHVERFHVRRR